VNIDRETVRKILTEDLDMRKVCAEMVPNELTEEKSKEEFLATKQITVLEHPAYLPDLAPSDFFLFPEIKEILKGRHFDDIDDIRSNTTAALKAIPQNQFQNCFEGCRGTLKATMVVFSNEVCSTFTAMSSRTLLANDVRHCITPYILCTLFLIYHRLCCQCRTT